MKIAFVLYDGITLLDFAGVFDPVTRLKSMGFVADLVWDLCSCQERIRSAEGIVLSPTRVSGDLAEYDYVIIPGGDGVKDLLQDKEFLRWISVASERTTVAAVCGGSLLLGAAGMLRTKRAATHPALAGFLRRFAMEVVPDRVADEGSIITASGVTAAIDLGLYLCEKIAGRDVRAGIAKQMDYSCYRINQA